MQNIVQKQKSTFRMSTSLLILLAFGLLHVVVFRIVQVHSGATTATEDVVVDKDDNYVMVTIGDVDMEPFYPTVNLHGMESRFSAYKNVSWGTCLIESIHQTMNGVITRLEDINNGRNVSDVETVTWTCSKQPMPYQILKALAGSRIANFCKPYRSYFVTRSSKRAVREVALPKFWCVICGFSICK